VQRKQLYEHITEKMIFLLTLLFCKVLSLVQFINRCVGKQHITNDHVVGDTVEYFTNTRCYFLITISQSYESGFVECSPQFDLWTMFFFRFKYLKTTLAYTSMAVTHLWAKCFEKKICVIFEIFNNVWVRPSTKILENVR